MPNALLIGQAVKLTKTSTSRERCQKKNFLAPYISTNSIPVLIKNCQKRFLAVLRKPTQAEGIHVEAKTQGK